ncbi:ATP-binding cassette domain-containing protein [Spiroplasma apis]|uniref:ABC transporter ATP-binding protein n=1 Tax=Spiroplasma apis B31 TaxID=1276258 RepID=V5RJ80_SPIAP|nr:ABC transporter ATP-binding protein [Spiroplasma apis]AHB36513.1 ABC transporter ATP-binding protein [Spiroplasma apis B31]
MEDLIIHFDEYVKKFRNHKIGPLSFGIKKGQFTAILGSSGSGKSVIINTIIGAIKTFHGKVTVNGFSKKSGKHFYGNKDISLYTQLDFSLFEMSAIPYLKQMCLIMGIPKKEIKAKIDYWLKYFDLWKDKTKKLKEYSWGMQNRLSLILCLIKEADVLVLDEPAANLDSFWRNKVRNLLIDYKNAGKTVIMTSHNIDEVNDLIDYYIVVEAGKLLFTGSKLQLDMYSKYKVFFSDEINLPKLKAFLKEKGLKTFKYDEFENSLVIATNTSKEINWVFLYSLKETAPILNLVKLPVNIESIYKALEANAKNNDIIKNLV